jgi:diguanylate cyclase (GGDEF)-like protein/PAS domain S-box-containing protein
MLKVRSLKPTIILQFAIIIAPITLVLVYQALSDVRHADSVKFELQSVALARQARDNYKAFLNGVADAVDTGTLGNRARQALEQTRESLLALQSWDRSFHSEPYVSLVDTLRNAARGNPSVKELLPLRPVANRVNVLLTALADSYDLREHANIENFALSVKRQVWIVLAATVITLVSAVGFVVLLIKGLTEPLNRAVTLAESIAAGDFGDEKSIDTSRDIGGLLTSLAAMQNGLRTAFRDLASNEFRLANAQRIAGIGDWEHDLVSGALTKSEEVYRIFGRAPGDLPVTSAIPLEMVHPEDKQLVEEFVNAAQHRGEDFNVDFRIVLPDGSTRYIHAQGEVLQNVSGKVVKLAGTIQDISARKLAEKQIEYLALHDGLTGLPNPRFFRDRVNNALAEAARMDTKLAALFLDLDRFKNVNDSLGHGIGDLLLKEVAERVTHCLRKADAVSREPEVPQNVLARLGGDEFTVLLTTLRHAEDAARVAQRILDALASPFRIEGHEIFTSASIGIAVFPDDGDDVETLLKNADTAMYSAKEEGRKNYKFFREEMNKAARAKLSLESDLHNALRQNEFILHYQPQIDVASREIVGVEALIRWQHPKRGLVPPLEFIPLAEERGLIIPIGEWVLRSACAQASAWHRAGLGKITVAVNMASPSFRQMDLMTVVADALEKSGLEPGYLELEVTESIMMHDMEAVLTMLKKLKGIGIHLSIDDFGTGYSSLSYLQRFPLDALKIDRSFVSNIDKPEGSAIALAIMALAKSLNLKVIAEGVETEHQVRTLREHGCEFMQGFLFSRPVPAEEMTRLLQQQKAGASIS